MYCYRKVTEDLYWIGSNDRRLARFEGVYRIPRGISYNSYLLLDEKTVLFDTVDRAVSEVFLESLDHLLDGRKLDYLVVHHMEPDHAAAMAEIILRYPEVKVICNAKILGMIRQFFTFDIDDRAQVVKEGDTVSFGKHNMAFINAPLVHWPEVMMSYDTTDKILFSADAFGTFGALDGALFADEVDFERDYLDEARRYYTNIVGKYGVQVTNVLKKAAKLDIAMLCPLHGFVWREKIGWYIDKYMKWATYTPEEKGVVIAYGSVYGNTANVVEILSCLLRERGVKVRVYDTSVTATDEVLSSTFRYSHVIFASVTYNSGIFIRMEELLHDLTAHAFQNRTVAVIENGTWGPTAGKQIRELLSGCKNITVLDQTLTIRSAMKEDQLPQLEALADAVAQSIRQEN